MTDDAVLRILNKPQSEWQKAELEEAFLLLLLEHTEAMKGWGSALESCDSLLTENKALLASFSMRQYAVDLLKSLGPNGDAHPKRGRGRPSKHADLSWLDDWHKEQVQKYGELNDRPLIKAAFEAMYERTGMRKIRVNSRVVKGQMETFRKLLVERRYQLKRLSQK